MGLGEYQDGARKRILYLPRYSRLVDVIFAPPIGGNWIAVAIERFWLKFNRWPPLPPRIVFRSQCLEFQINPFGRSWERVIRYLSGAMGVPEDFSYPCHVSLGPQLLFFSNPRLLVWFWTTAGRLGGRAEIVVYVNYTTKTARWLNFQTPALAQCRLK